MNLAGSEWWSWGGGSKVQRSAVNAFFFFVLLLFSLTVLRLSGRGLVTILNDITLVVSTLWQQ